MGTNIGRVRGVHRLATKTRNAFSDTDHWVAWYRETFASYTLSDSFLESFDASNRNAYVACWEECSNLMTSFSAALDTLGSLYRPEESMLEVLERVERVIPQLLSDVEGWCSLDVDYEPPRVERLWRTFEGYRVYLHRIHPSPQALFHPHPWPSAIKVLSGKYRMRVGYGSGDQAPPTAATVVLTAGASYQMTDPDGWHSVQPIGDPSLSIMITGEPWGRSVPTEVPPLSPLSVAAKEDLLSVFRGLYNVLSG